MREGELSLIGRVPVRTYAAVQDAGARTAVLLYHGLRSSAESLADEARALAAAGITAVLPDAPHHGERRSPVLDAMPDTATREGYRTLLSILRDARDEVPGLVDHLLRLGYARVGIGGASMGGYIALSAADVEPRIAAIVSLLGSPDWTPHEGEAARDPGDLAAALAESPHLRPQAFPPRPLMLLHGARDANVLPGPVRAFAALVRPLYDARGAGASLVHREYDVDHFPPPGTWRAMVDDAVSFLARWCLSTG